ncbi:MAG: hypothetical protein DRP57_05730 [Spirochaetes bacterium]|nr:MAG: hypothetical protein DRP57_05730 [Spirochaetota bacterium]
MNKNWGIFNLNKDTLFSKQFGELKLRVKKDCNELSLACTHSTSTRSRGKTELETVHEPQPENVSWVHWVISDEPKSVEISPLLPDRPLIVKTESPFFLAAGTEKLIFIGIPIWIAVNSAGKEKIRLLEAPLQILSNTWFGNFESGELCYWASVRAEQPQVGKPQAEQPQAGQQAQQTLKALCSVRLSNMANESLPVEKMYLPVPNLTLFNADGRLWTDEVAVSCRGADEAGQVKFSGKPPENLIHASIAAAPRQKSAKNIFLKSFSSINSIWGFNVQE